jgi:hypothetical protein
MPSTELGAPCDDLHRVRYRCDHREHEQELGSALDQFPVRPLLGDRSAALGADLPISLRFMETMKDPMFIADADKAQLEVNPVAGEELQTLVADIYKTPPEIAKQAAQLLAPK